MIDDDFWSNWWNENWQGKPKYSEKTYPSATLSTTNPTWQTRSQSHLPTYLPTHQITYLPTYLHTKPPTYLPTCASIPSIHPSTALQSFWLDSGRFFSFLILYTVGRTPWTGISPSQGRYLHTEHKINAKQISMPWLRLEPTIPEFEVAKTYHALEWAATVIGTVLQLVTRRLITLFTTVTDS
jgi:hypothetical protein